MSHRERVALVTPRPEAQAWARSWGPLLGDRADLVLCDTPSDDRALAADLMLVDETVPGLVDWIARESDAGRSPETIVVVAGEAPDLGSVGWGEGGTEVLATISDFLDRRRLLEEADRFVHELRESNARLDEHRRGFAQLVLDQAEALQGANTSLSRELDELRRLQSVARFFAAPGPPETFGDRLAEVAGRALGAAGAAFARRDGDAWTLEGLWKISRRSARNFFPTDDAGEVRRGPLPSTRKGMEGWWLPITVRSPGSTGLAILVQPSTFPGAGRDEFVEHVTALLAEGIGTRSATEDLLSRKHQSERILQTLRGGLLKIDAQRRIVLANPACAEILDTTVEHLEGLTLREAFPRDAHMHELLQSVADGRGSIDDMETHIHTPRGRRLSVSLRASLLRDASHATNEILVLISDLSRRKAVEAEVRRADRLAALGRLSAGVAHEIRNPLAGIRTTAEILRGRVEHSAELLPVVDVILEEAARLDRIVGSLLQFAKPPEPRWDPVSLVDVLSRAKQLAAGRAADRGVTIRTLVADGLPTPLADRDQILQVLLNLLLNGIEATEQGGEVRLGAEVPQDRDRACVVLFVEDCGDGIPESIRERIFDPFFTTKPGGTGLGLSISRNILRQHGGSLQIERNANDWTRASVSIPISPSRRDDLARKGVK
jgi:PAS domain S-box-containing protein